MNAPSLDTIVDIARATARVAAMPRIFPFKIASLVRDALRDPENKLATPHLDYPGADASPTVQTIGDCRYAISVIDANGTRYRVIVEVDPTPPRADADQIERAAA